MVIHSLVAVKQDGKIRKFLKTMIIRIPVPKDEIYEYATTEGGKLISRTEADFIKEEEENQKKHTKLPFVNESLPYLDDTKQGDYMEDFIGRVYKHYAKIFKEEGKEELLAALSKKETKYI